MQTVIRLWCIALLMLVVSACRQGEKIYTSDCNDGHTFTRVILTNLLDSAVFYNNKFVEISGKFVNDKNSSILIGYKPGEVLTIEFSNGCPLFLNGTRVGFFDYDNNKGQLTPANNTTMKFRGEIVVHPGTYKNGFKVSLAHISYVQF